MKLTKKQQVRLDSLLPGGIPKWVHCYDNGGPDKAGGSLDRYTVVFTGNYQKNLFAPGSGMRAYQYVSMNGGPYHPQMGIYQHGESHDHPIDWPTYGHLGKKIKFTDLPEDCRTAVLQDYRDIWNLPTVPAEDPADGSPTLSTN